MQGLVYHCYHSPDIRVLRMQGLVYHCYHSLDIRVLRMQGLVYIVTIVLILGYSECRTSLPLLP